MAEMENTREKIGYPEDLGKASDMAFVTSLF